MTTLRQVFDPNYGRHHRSASIFPYLIVHNPDASPAIREWARRVMDHAGRRHPGAARHRAAVAA